MKPNPLFPTDETLGINTDLYELTMAAAYFQSGRSQDIATFELFTRQLPDKRNFLIAAGLEQALHCVLNAGFQGKTIDYLKQLEVFRHVDPRFFDYLRVFRFSGEIWALPEGTPFFENEPILQVRAPIIEAQILETYLINSVNVQSMVASKAARLCIASRGRDVVDFGSRRAHGPQTGVLAARASYIGGCAGTSNVLAGYEMGIPVLGTMAHSFVQSFDEEVEAFEAFIEVFPDQATLLVDTYDSIEGIRTAIEMGKSFRGIRLDSGDLARLAVRAREILDEAGKPEVKIFVSGNLNEELLHSYSLRNLPIDGYGVGTEMVVSSDAPGCDLVYKLVELERGEQIAPKFKASEDKGTFPHRKQVCRLIDDGSFERDIVIRHDEPPPAGSETLLKKVLQDGRLVSPLPSILEIRETARTNLERLPVPAKQLHTKEWYPVEISEVLQRSRAKLEARYTG